MKTIGMSLRSAATRFCKSRPLRSGRPTSSTRQLGARTRGRDRNSRAEANVSACQPAQRISNSSDSRTDTSSSTTNTMGAMGAGRDIERGEQRRFAEWLEQALYRTLCEQAATDDLILVRGDEDDRNRPPATRQFPLEIGSRHARHGNVENHTLGPVDVIGREELFR